jgi:hypothetical protein
VQLVKFSWWKYLFVLVLPPVMGLWIFCSADEVRGMLFGLLILAGWTYFWIYDSHAAVHEYELSVMFDIRGRLAELESKIDRAEHADDLANLLKKVRKPQPGEQQ